MRCGGRRAYFLAQSAADTVYALSSGAPPCGVAVVRTSGPAAAATARALGAAAALAAPRALCLAALRHAGPGGPGALDRALVAYFPAGASYTGEDVVEYHLHGGVATVRAVLAALAAAGLRAAAPGEFTRRAVARGRMGADQAAALGALLRAETEQQRRLALRAMGERWGPRLEAWRARLVQTLAHVVALLDFPDDLVPGDGAADAGGAAGPTDAAAIAVAGRLADIAVEMRDAMRGAALSERLRRGASLVLVGPPNAGKSSLLNVLARRRAAIVSEVPGTTRDAIEVALDLYGFPITAVDTAGLRAAPADALEREGMRVARERLAASDLRVLLIDGADCSGPDADALLAEFGRDAFVIFNKLDAVGGADGEERLRALAVRHSLTRVAFVSLHTGAGVDEMHGALEAFVAQWFRAAESSNDFAAVDAVLLPQIVSEALSRACSFVEAAERRAHESMDMCAAELHSAVAELSTLSEPVHVEAVLDEVFKNFCIGK